MINQKNNNNINLTSQYYNDSSEKNMNSSSN